MRYVLRFLRDECGQDIIEYALLAAFIGTAGAVAWLNIQSGVPAALGVGQRREHSFELYAGSGWWRLRGWFVAGTDSS